MKHLVTILFLFCCIQYSAAQTYTIKGSVKDTLNIAPLPLASVVLFNAKDSVIVAYTRADSAGNFTLNADKQGKYIVRVTFPGFADYVDPVAVNKSSTDLGPVSYTHLTLPTILRV